MMMTKKMLRILMRRRRWLKNNIFSKSHRLIMIWSLKSSIRTLEILMVIISILLNHILIGIIIRFYQILINMKQSKSIKSLMLLLKHLLKRIKILDSLKTIKISRINQIKWKISIILIFKIFLKEISDAIIFILYLYFKLFFLF
jgi:hypothetical protein